MKERQPVKGLKKQNGDESGHRNTSEGSKSGEKFNPETHMESQDHLQTVIEYLRKYQKESGEVGDSEPDNTHAENHDVDDGNPRPRSEKVSSSFGSNMQICKEWIKTGACTVGYCKFKHFDPNASYPYYVKTNSDNSAVDNDRTKVLRKNSKWTPVDRPTKACYQFSDLGYCKYGNRCRFEHIRPTRNYDNHKSRPSTAELRNYPNIDSMNFSQRCICFSF